MLIQDTRRTRLGQPFISGTAGGGAAGEEAEAAEGQKGPR